MSINYRVDKQAKLVAGEDYRVPCGMGTIMWSSDTQPNLLSLTKIITPKLEEGYVGVYSRWDADKHDFVVRAILEGAN